MQRPQWQWPASLHGTHEGGKVGIEPWAIHQRWPNGNHLHPSVGSHLLQTLLGFILTLAVGIFWLGDRLRLSSVARDTTVMASCTYRSNNAG